MANKIETTEAQLNNAIDLVDVLQDFNDVFKSVRAVAKAAKLGADLQLLGEEIKTLQVSAKMHQKEVAATLKQLKKAAK